MAGLLSPSFLLRLEGLALATRRRLAQGDTGERAGLRRGQSLEFADHRPYAAGDDLRHLDWRLFGRLGRPYVKRFEERSELGVTLLVDASASMSDEAPRDAPSGALPSKWLLARQLAGALAYVALCGGDRVQVAALGGRQGRPPAPVRGRDRVHAILTYLEGLATDEVGRATDVRAELARAAAHRPRGMLIVVSDLLFAGAVEAVAALAFAPRQVVVVQLFGCEERGLW